MHISNHPELAALVADHAEDISAAFAGLDISSPVTVENVLGAAHRHPELLSYLDEIETIGTDGKRRTAGDRFRDALQIVSNIGGIAEAIRGASKPQPQPEEAITIAPAPQQRKGLPRGIVVGLIVLGGLLAVYAGIKFYKK